MFSFVPKPHVLKRDDAVADAALGDPHNRRYTDSQIAGACIRHERSAIILHIQGMPTPGRMTAAEFQGRLLEYLYARAEGKKPGEG